MFTKPKKELTDAGYSCSKVATGFTECTKKGEDTYWCDASDTCDVKPFRQDIVETTTLPRGGGKMTTMP